MRNNYIINLFTRFFKRIYKKGFWDTIRLSFCYIIDQKTIIKQNYYLNITLPKLCRQSSISLLNKKGNKLKYATLNYIKLNQKVAHDFGAYSFKLGGPPLLYTSCYAALTRDLYGDLDSILSSERMQWIDYIQSFQSDDGLFRDPLIDVPLAGRVNSWGWRHLTLHAVMAIFSLGGVVQKPFKLIDPFRKPGQIAEWIEGRNWKTDPAEVSNEVQNYATLLQYTRDFQNEAWCQDALDEMYDWLDAHQDPKTGLWGNSFESPQLLSTGVQTGYHLWLLYFYDRRPIQYMDRIIDSCLATQNRLGGFGVPLNSSACEDIDSIDPLARLYHQTDYRRSDIYQALEKALPWVITNANLDGGWVFRRGQPLGYGHELMTAEREESCLFPTWFRSLSLGYLAQVLTDQAISEVKWQFLLSPGHQFWNPVLPIKNERLV